jgi:hypothetical protein
VLEQPGAHHKKTALQGRFIRLFLDVVLPAEAFNSTGRIDEFLLSRKERMTRGTNFDVDVLYRRARFDHIPAHAGDLCKFVFGVNTLFHLCILQST